MIEAHTIDAWTRASDRSTTAFRNLTILGGFAAPLFLWLAGVALALAAERAAARRGDRRTAALDVVTRGLQIFVLAFLFRIQAFIVSPGSPLVALFRVDILNVMGPSIVAAGLVWGLSRRPIAAAITSSVFAIAVAMATPLVRTAGWVDLLPVWLQWYVRPAGEYTTFTLFPWSAFVPAGVAAGALIFTSERTIRWMAIAGAALAWGGYQASLRPSLYPASSFWTTSPSFFAIRVGILMLVLAAAFGAWRVAGARVSHALEPLARLGRRSLFVYWIHVELVYGYATWLLRGRLPVWGAVAACAAFSLLMYKAIDLGDWLLSTWRHPPKPRNNAQSLST